jgi:hypothetical protein
MINCFLKKNIPEYLFIDKTKQVLSANKAIKQRAAQTYKKATFNLDRVYIL